MINNIFPMTVQTGVVAITDPPVTSPFSAASAWIDDEVNWVLVWGN